MNIPRPAKRRERDRETEHTTASHLHTYILNKQTNKQKVSPSVLGSAAHRTTSAKIQEPFSLLLHCLAATFNSPQDRPSGGQHETHRGKQAFRGAAAALWQTTSTIGYTRHIPIPNYAKVVLMVGSRRRPGTVFNSVPEDNSIKNLDGDCTPTHFASGASRYASVKDKTRTVQA